MDIKTYDKILIFQADWKIASSGPGFYLLRYTISLIPGFMHHGQHQTPYMDALYIIPQN